MYFPKIRRIFSGHSFDENRVVCWVGYMNDNNNLTKFTVASINVHGWRDKKDKLTRQLLLQEVKKLNVDVIALQEVKHPFPCSKATIVQEENEVEGVVRIVFKDEKYNVDLLSNWNDEKIKEEICIQVNIPLSAELKLFTEKNGECGEEVHDFEKLRSAKYLQKFILVTDTEERTIHPTMSQLEYFAKELNMDFHFQSALDQTFGNAILSKYPLTKVIQQTIPLQNAETRSVVGGNITVQERHVGVYCIHLDDKKEETRLQQFEQIRSLVDCSVPHVILGDFNALKRTDYSEEKWNEIAQTRSKFRIEPPKGDLLQLLETKYHYSVCSGNEITCAYGTRIDYVLASPDFFHPMNSFVKNTEATDHALVLTEFSLQPYFLQKVQLRSTLVILGGPGCGKGTQCDKLVEHRGYSHFSIGELLRQAAINGSKYADIIKEHQTSGTMVPREIKMEILLEAIQSSKNDKIVIDNYIEKEMCSFVDHVLVLKCSEEAMKQRMEGRNRSDDQDATAVQRRLNRFKENDLPLIEFLEKFHKVRWVTPINTVSDLPD
mmetsp:Transcript_6335/g.8807  ORF Transcript_6335/g.8807 Transcript_6335/m.8807 type:complete len:548 (+) Transcript_6335:83-1726(+)